MQLKKECCAQEQLVWDPLSRNRLANTPEWVLIMGISAIFR